MHFGYFSGFPHKQVVTYSQSVPTEHRVLLNGDSCSQSPFATNNQCRKLPLGRLQLGWAEATGIGQYG